MYFLNGKTEHSYFSKDFKSNAVVSTGKTRLENAVQSMMKFDKDQSPQLIHFDNQNNPNYTVGLSIILLSLQIFSERFIFVYVQLSFTFKIDVSEDDSNASVCHRNGAEFRYFPIGYKTKFNLQVK